MVSIHTFHDVCHIFGRRSPRQAAAAGQKFLLLEHNAGGRRAYFILDSCFIGQQEEAIVSGLDRSGASKRLSSAA
jgi:hypothetical protein